ncbi:MAG: beta-N-acetylhexosaminidase [Sphaerochaetaceae bacterium]
MPQTAQYILKIGQRLVSGFPGTSMSGDFIDLVKTRKVGNVILFAHNIESKTQLLQLCCAIQKLVREQTGHEAFIAIDQEGGMVTRLSEDATNIPGAMAIAATGNPVNAYRAGLITARELRALGVNFNLAPVMDVNSNKNNPVIGVRSYGDTTRTVSHFGVQMIKGLTDGGVLCAAKHFPGHGDTDVDSHLGLPMVDKSLAELEQNDLAPFKAAIGMDVPGIMSSHILFPQLEPGKIPATMSRTILTGILKERMGFHGLVLSDCMEMGAISDYYGSVNGAVAAIQAGVDLVFISHTAPLAAQAADAIQAALTSGRLDLAEMDRSVEKILRYKERVARLPAMESDIVGCAAHRDAIAQMMAESITQVHTPIQGQPDLGSNPWFVGCRPFRATNASSMLENQVTFAGYLADALGGKATVTPFDPTEEEILQLTKEAQGHSCIVVGLYNGHLNKGQLSLTNCLAKTGIPTIAVALRNPYDLAYLAKNIHSIAAYEYTRLSLDAIAQVLSKKREAPGVLSVKI